MSGSATTWPSTPGSSPARPGSGHAGPESPTRLTPSTAGPNNRPTGGAPHLRTLGVPAAEAPAVSRRRTKVNNAHLRESIALYLRMQAATTEAEFRELLARHDACTDADGKPRLACRTLEEFRRGRRGRPTSPPSGGRPPAVDRPAVVHFRRATPQARPPAPGPIQVAAVRPRKGRPAAAAAGQRRRPLAVPVRLRADGRGPGRQPDQRQHHVVRLPAAAGHRDSVAGPARLPRRPVPRAAGEGVDDRPHCRPVRRHPADRHRGVSTGGRAALTRQRRG